MTEGTYQLFIQPESDAAPASEKLGDDAQIIEVGSISDHSRTLANIRLARLQTDFARDPAFDPSSMPMPLDFITGVKAYIADEAIDLKQWPPAFWNQKVPVLRALMQLSRLDGRVDELEERDPVSLSIIPNLVAASAAMSSGSEAVVTWRTLLQHLYRLRLDELDHTGRPEADEHWDIILAKVQALTPDGV